MCPLNDMFGFTSSIRSVTEGKGEFAMEFSHYDHCRDDVQEKLISDYQAEQRALRAEPDKRKKKGKSGAPR